MTKPGASRRSLLGLITHSTALPMQLDEARQSCLPLPYNLPLRGAFPPFEAGRNHLTAALFMICTGCFKLFNF